MRRQALRWVPPSGSTSEWRKVDASGPLPMVSRKRREGLREARTDLEVESFTASA